MNLRWLAIVLAVLIGLTATYADAQGIVVQIRPPHSVAQSRGHAPGPNYVWIPGYQNWSGNRYVWVPGRWEIPPRRHARWEPYRWDKRGHGWVLREGRWR